MLASLTGEPEGFEAAAVAFGEYVAYAHRMIAARRAEPRDDLFSILVHAEVDGERLSDDDIVFESLLLLIGGDETTRQVTAGGMELLLRAPRPDGGARRRSRRRCRSRSRRCCGGCRRSRAWRAPRPRDVELEGAPLPRRRQGRAALRVGQLRRAPVRRAGAVRRRRGRPNEHLAFGFGPHVCLGASLARLELQTMFDCILRRLPDLELATDEPLTRSITGIERLPVRFTPSAPARR